MDTENEDTEENYRAHLAKLISRTRSRGHSRYFNDFVNRCREQAAIDYPKGAAAAKKKDRQAAGFWGVILTMFAFLG